MNKIKKILMRDKIVEQLKFFWRKASLVPTASPNSNVSLSKIKLIDVDVCQEYEYCRSFQQFDFREILGRHLNPNWILPQKQLEIVALNISTKCLSTCPNTCSTIPHLLMHLLPTYMQNATYKPMYWTEGTNIFVQSLRIYNTTMVFLQINCHHHELNEEQREFFNVVIHTPMNSLLFDVL